MYASAQTSGYQLKALVAAAATMGVTQSVLEPGPEGRIDWRAVLRVTFWGAVAMAVTAAIGALFGTTIG